MSLFLHIALRRYTSINTKCGKLTDNAASKMTYESELTDNQITSNEEKRHGENLVDDHNLLILYNIH